MVSTVCMGHPIEGVIEAQWDSSGQEHMERNYTELPQKAYVRQIECHINHHDISLAGGQWGRRIAATADYRIMANCPVCNCRMTIYPMVDRMVQSEVGKKEAYMPLHCVNCKQQLHVYEPNANMFWSLLFKEVMGDFENALAGLKAKGERYAKYVQYKKDRMHWCNANGATFAEYDAHLRELEEKRWEEMSSEDEEYYDE